MMALSLSLCTHANTAKPSACHVGNPEQEAPAHIQSFFKRLQDDVRRNDVPATARMMHYPLLVSTQSGKLRIRSASEFVRSYTIIFTPKFKEAFLEQRSNCVSRVGARGFSYGNGDMWFDEYPDGQVRVFTINSVR